MRFSFPRNRIVVSLCLVVILTLGLAASASADDVAGTSNITGGDLTLGAGDAPAVSATLNGTDQTVSDDFTISVNDFRGTGAGWNLQITSTAFSDGSHSLSNSASKITAMNVACDQGTCTNPTSAISYPLTVPADATAPTAVKLFNAVLNTGMGDFTVTPTFAVALPANTYAGNYSSTITLSLVTGP